MADLADRKMLYEVLVERSDRWNIVDVLDSRDDALALGERLRATHGAVKVTIERYDPDTRLYSTVVIWEWRRAKPAGPTPGMGTGPGARVRAPGMHEPRPSKAPVPWWRRLFGLR